MNTLLNSGFNLRILDDEDIDSIWESIFFALWYAEMGRGCEEIIAAVERACSRSYRLTRVGFKTIAKKWYGLDQYRVDKVSHLARHLLPVLLKHQIVLWLKSSTKSKKLGTKDVNCKKILLKTFNEVAGSYGLCYFLLEILAEEISVSCTAIYERLHIYVGKFELKANLIVFLYSQIIEFISSTKLDARLLRTFDRYVIKKFFEEIFPDQSQLVQILISLRLYQALDRFKNKKASSGKSKALLDRWSNILRDSHEKCINGEYFIPSVVPVKATINMLPPHYQRVLYENK